MEKDPTSLQILSRVKEIKSFVGRMSDSIDIILIRKGNRYEIFRGLNFDQDGNIIGVDSIALDDPASPFVTNPERYIYAIERIEGMNNLKRSGDIVLVFKFDTYDQPANRFTSGVSCKSWHASLNPTDSYVPFIISYPGGNRYELERIVKRVCPDFKCRYNWKLTELVLEIIRSQYDTK